MPKKLPPTVEAAVQIMRAAMSVDQGNDQQASGFLQDAATISATGKSSEQQSSIALDRVALAFAAAQPGAKKMLHAFVEAERTRVAAMGKTEDSGPAIQLALAAMLAARNGEAGVARAALDASRDLALNHGYYDRSALWRTAECETQFAQLPKDQVDCLSKLLDGREYFQTHVALVLAYRAVDDKVNEKKQTEWLASHRGQAVAELENLPALIQNLVALRTLARPNH